MFKKLKFRNLTIGRKYGVMLIIIFLFIATSTTIVSTLIINMGSNIDELDRRGERTADMMEMGSLIRGKSIRIVSYINYPEPALIDEYEERSERFNELQSEIASSMRSDEQRELFNQIIENDEELNDMFLNKIVPAVNDGDLTGANTYGGLANVLRSDTVILLEELSETVKEEQREAITVAYSSQELMLIIQITSMAASIIIGSLLVIFISRAVSRNLNRVVEVSNRIANGDLSVEEISYKGNDEIGQLAKSMNTMRNSLRKIIQQVSDVSETVSSQSEELTQSVN